MKKKTPLPANTDDEIKDEIKEQAAQPKEGLDFPFDSLTKELQDFINSTGFALKTKERLPRFFGLLDADPNMSIVDLCAQSGIRRPTYYSLLKNKAFAAQLSEFRATRVREDVKNAYSRLVTLVNSKNELIAMQATKFMLENNGQEYGFGKKDDNTGVVRIEIEDKRMDVPKYTDEDLEDV